MQCSCSVSQLWLCVDLTRAVGIGGRCMWGVCLCKEQKKKAWCKSVCATKLPSPPNRYSRYAVAALWVVEYTLLWQYVESAAGRAHLLWCCATVDHPSA